MPCLQVHILRVIRHKCTYLCNYNQQINRVTVTRVFLKKGLASPNKKQQTFSSLCEIQVKTLSKVILCKIYTIHVDTTTFDYLIKHNIILTLQQENHSKIQISVKQHSTHINKLTNSVNEIFANSRRIVRLAPLLVYDELTIV